MATVNEKMTAIADAIREKTGETEALSLDDMAVKIPSVYDKGKQSQYDEFWDNFQDYGNREYYQYAFYNPYIDKYWNSMNLKPKYDIVCGANCTSMFYYCGCEYLKKGFDGAEELNIDTSQVTTAQTMFYNTRLKKIPKLDFSKVTSMANCFRLNGYLEELSLIFSENTIFHNEAFTGCSRLSDLTIEGKIANDNFNVQWSTSLNKKSIISIIGALSLDTTSMSVTLSRIAVNNAFDEYEWEALLVARPNWTVSLM